MIRLLSWLTGVALLVVVSAGPLSAQPADEDTRPATTTFFGDTGLWFVPTGEVLPGGKISASGYRANWDRPEGLLDVSHFAFTFAAGVGGRAELFASVRADTRIRRGHRTPIFSGANAAGGVNFEYPFTNTGWSGDNFGDVLLGAKFNLLSESRQQPMALAVRGAVKLPTGDSDAGVSTGKADLLLDAIFSKEGGGVEFAGFGGATIRANPDNMTLPNSVRWGFGAAFPSRSPLRVVAEVRGEALTTSSVTLTSPILGSDGTLSPMTTAQESPVDTMVGLMWQGAGGFFVGGGFTWAAQHDSRSSFGLPSNSGDTLGLQVRLGYHPGTRVYTPPPPPPPPPPAPVNRPPTVTARCDPCTVEVGRTSTLTADAQDPDGDPLTYRWSVPAGTLASPTDRQTIWTAPDQEGPVQATVTVDDGRGGTASDSVTLQVIRPPVVELVFEDVHFDFDRYTLRPEAVRVLDEAVQAMQDTPTLRLTVEGHTCNIGTAEYNLALGERRAHAVRDYLTSRGISADRLQTVSYGEERPKHDNAREETRRLNRRAAMVVRLQ